MWSIVHFKEDNSVEVVPSKWVTKYKCAWPNINTRKCIESQSDPNTQAFSWFKARAMLSNIESYSEAFQKCKKAVFTSDLSSSENDVQVSKRKLNSIKNSNHGKPGVDTDDSDNMDYEMPNYESDNNDERTISRSPNKRSKKSVKTTSKNLPVGKSPIKGSSSQKFFSPHVPDTVLSPKQVEKSPIKASSSQKFFAPHVPVTVLSPNQVEKSPKKASSSQKFFSPHVPDTVLSPKQVEKSPKKASSSQKFLSPHVPDTVLSPKQVEKSPKKVSSSQKFSWKYNAASDTMSSPKLQNYENIMSPKTSLSQKYDVSPIKKTPTKISFNDYSPNLFLSSQKHYSPKNSKYNLSSMPGHFVKKQLFKPKESSSTHSTSSMKTSSMRSSDTKKSKVLTDDQFKDMVSHNLIIMKHSIRNLNEKLDLMIERSSKLSQTSNLIHEDDVADNYTNLNCIFPINDVNTLNDIEEQLAADKTYHKLMTNKLVGLGGKTIQIYVKRVMQLLFTDELLKNFSFNGRANKKKCFCNLIISKLIFSSIKTMKKFNYDGATDDAEKYIKNALIQAPFNIKKKSTSCSAAAIITSPQR